MNPDINFFKRMAAGRSIRDICFVFTVFAVSRLYVVLGIFLGRKFISFPDNIFRSKILEPDWWQSLVRWDSRFYIDIAVNGYSWLPDGRMHNIDFFPLYPMLIKGVNFLFGISPIIAGLALSNVFFFGALLLVHKYTKKYHTDSDAGLTTLLMAFSPFGVFFSSVYNESLFLFLCLLAFFMFREERMIESSFALCLAGATRLAGVFIIVTIGLSYILATVVLINRKPKINGGNLLRLTGWGLVSILGFSLFLLYQQLSFGHWNAFITTQTAFNRHPVGSFGALLSEISPDPFFIMNLFPTLAVLFVSLLFLFIREYRLYSAWGLLTVLVPLSTGTFISMTRFSIVYFPLFIYGSFLLKKIHLLRDITIVICSSALLVSTALFARFYFLG